MLLLIHCFRVRNRKNKNYKNQNHKNRKTNEILHQIEAKCNFMPIPQNAGLPGLHYLGAEI